MKIAIIGAGWIGCHLANKFKKNHNVHIFDSHGIFSGSSFKNQNRLHLGFHYARNHSTRVLCLDTFEKFFKDYKHVTSNIENNIYSIPIRESLIDFQTYLSIFKSKKFKYKKVTVPELKGIEGSICVEEKYIDPWKSKSFFQEKLNNIFSKRKIELKNIEKLKKKYDLVINCTNNFFSPIKEEFFYELCIVLKYKKKNKTSFDALTLVDGKLFSIYPYKNDIFTVTCVEYTPMFSFEKLQDLKNKQKKINFYDIENIKNNFEKVIFKNFPNFKDYFNYVGNFFSIKSKNRNESSNRNPVINVDENFISCYTGKIQGIYCVEDFILNRI